MEPFDSRDDYSLFKFLVGRLVRLKCSGNYYTNNQYANLIFGKADGGNMAYVTRVWSTYRNYFETQGIYKKRLRLEKVKKDHPGILGIDTGGVDPTPVATNLSVMLAEMIQALNQEIIAVKQTTRSIKMDNLYSLNRISDKYIYAGLLHIDRDDEIILNEGAIVTLGPAKIAGAVLSYDQLNCILYFECSAQLDLRYYYFMEVDTVITIRPIIDALKTCERDKIEGLSKVFAQKQFPVRLPEKTTFDTNNLDETQLKAANKALSNNVTFIWGPPGTGKSHCLAEIINELLRRNEKTLVISIANVAVDQLLSKVLDGVDNHSSSSSTRLINDGKISRIGYITDEPLIKRFDNAPASKHILTLYKSIREVQQEISRTKDESNRAFLTAQKRSLSREVNEIQRKRIELSTLLFTTATKGLMDESIVGTDFDNLIVDEASMMSIPYLFATLKRIKKRVIIAGDFAQLAPISLSQTNLAEKYLKKDLFSLAGITKANPNHASLAILKINRRAIKQICDLYNQAFYYNEMTTFRADEESDKTGIYYIPLESYGAERTKAGSRRNRYSFNVVTDFVKKHLLTSNETFGIISPYRAQVNDYRKYFKECGYPFEIQNRIKVGTIHTFQGSEADVIIFDTVDNCEIGVGRLFHYEQGERLMNVAISRARNRLIVFGDLEAFYKSNKVTAKVLSVLNRLKEKTVS